MNGFLLDTKSHPFIARPCFDCFDSAPRQFLAKTGILHSLNTDDDRGRDHRDTIAGGHQGDGRMRSAALKEHAWANARNPACSLEPITRSKFVAEKQKGLGRTSLTRRNVGASHTPGNHTDRTAWLGRQDSNLGMAESKSS
jgi:hypothetical protein